MRAGAELGSEGRGGRNSVLAVRVRHWHRVVHSQKIPAVVPQKGRLPLGQKESGYHPQSVRHDQCPAVHHELWHPDGAGSCEQLWHRDHGGVCGGGGD